MFRVASDSDCEKEHGRIRVLARPQAVRLRTAARRPASRRRPNRRRGCCASNHGLEASVVNMMVEPPRRGAGRREGHRRALAEQPALARSAPSWRSSSRGSCRTCNFTLAGGPCPGGQDVLRRRGRGGRAPAERDDARRGALRGDRRAVRSREDLPQHLEHRRFPEHLPAGLDPRRAGGELLRPGRPRSRRMQLGRVATSIDDMREADPRAARRRRLPREHRPAARAISRAANSPARWPPATSNYWNENRGAFVIDAADGGTIP